MNTSLVLACTWALVANVIGMFPSKRNHWPQAYVLVAVGVPIIGYVTYENGPWIGLLVMALGAWILRWPVRYFARWVMRKIKRADPVESET